MGSWWCTRQLTVNAHCSLILSYGSHNRLYFVRKACVFDCRRHRWVCISPCLSRHLKGNEFLRSTSKTKKYRTSLAVVLDISTVAFEFMILESKIQGSVVDSGIRCFDVAILRRGSLIQNLATDLEFMACFTGRFKLRLCFSE